MAEPTMIPIATELVELLRRPEGLTREGVLRLRIEEDGTLYVEMIHDCFLMLCDHNGWDRRAAQRDGRDDV